MADEKQLEFIRRLKMLRKEKKMSQTDLADAIGKTTRMVQKYEGAEVMPRKVVLEQIALVLDVRADYLLGETEKRDRPETIKETTKEYARKISLAFAGGELPPEDIDRVFYMINQAYLNSKKDEILNEED